jgi:hypothetical protein
MNFRLPRLRSARSKAPFFDPRENIDKPIGGTGRVGARFCYFLPLNWTEWPDPKRRSTRSIPRVWITRESGPVSHTFIANLGYAFLDGISHRGACQYDIGE